MARRIVDFMDERIAGLENPRNTGKAMVGRHGGFWRYRVGDCRVICDIQDGALRVSLWCRLATGVRFIDRHIMAARMGMTQSEVARIENGRGTPSMRTVQRFARAVGARAVVRMEPLTAA